MKIALTLITLTLILGCLSTPEGEDGNILNPETSTSTFSQEELEYRILIADEDRACELNMDCSWTYTTCDGCECPQPVNKKHLEKYRNKLTEKCADYKDELCETECRPMTLQCQQGKCVEKKTVKRYSSS